MATVVSSVPPQTCNEHVSPFVFHVSQVSFVRATIAPLAILVLVLGFWPRPLLNLIDQGSLEIHRMVDKPGQTQIASLSDSALPSSSKNAHAGK